MSILNELYHEWHSPREKHRPEEREAWGCTENLWEQAEKCLDSELFVELQRSVAVLIDLESSWEFEEGFRLGVQLMLELNLPGAALPAQQ